MTVVTSGTVREIGSVREIEAAATETGSANGIEIVVTTIVNGTVIANANVPVTATESIAPDHGVMMLRAITIERDGTARKSARGSTAAESKEGLSRSSPTATSVRRRRGVAGPKMRMIAAILGIQR